MKTRLTALLAVCLVAGCGQNAAPEAVSQDAQPQVQAEQPCTQTSFYSPLPSELQVQFPFHLRSDRIFTNKKGTVRRRVTLETLNGTAQEAFESASQSLVAAGYKAKGKLKGSPDKKQAQSFARKGQPSIALVSSVDVGSKPANPDAIGLVYFEWTPQGAKASAPVVAQ
ncbi:hypothetical protein ACTJIL_12535 [Luteimonas sp. 22616]|uniref:hypothetical protein n=1 Tax=Luteimonas sp. 22616 TaxID=3453951 RepID=UPI003F846D05